MSDFEDFIAQQQQAQNQYYEQQQMQSEAFKHNLLRLVIDELDEEQLDTVHALFSFVANAQDPAAIANYYEGFVGAVAAVRKRNAIDPVEAVTAATPRRPRTPRRP